MARVNADLMIRFPLVEERDRAILACERLTKERDDAARCVRLLIERDRLQTRIHRARLQRNNAAASEALGERWSQWKRLPKWLRAELGGT